MPQKKNRAVISTMGHMAAKPLEAAGAGVGVIRLSLYAVLKTLFCIWH